MANGIVIDDKTVAGGVGQTNPLPIRIKDGATGNDVNPATQETLVEIETNTTVGLLSPENSTTTPLLAGATFTGTAVDLKDYVTVNVVIKASHASATDGFCIDFSSDGTNWDITECHTVPAATGEAHLSRAKGRYCRIRYTNGGTNQTYFRLTTTFKNTAVSMTYEQLSIDVDDTHDAALVRAILAGKKPNGDYTNAQFTTAGNQKFSLEELDVNMVSSGNSSTTPLGISGVFTGTSEEVLQYSQISILLKTDKDSATLGMSLQFSNDGTNWDHSEDYTITGGTEFVHQAMTEGRYFRIVYTNGTLAQTYFRLQVIYKTIPQTSEIMGIDHIITDDDDAMIVRAVLNAKNPGGVYGNINRTTAGNLKISIEEIDAGAGLATEATQADSLNNYKISNIDTSTPSYYGFTDKAGNWYIMKNDSGAYTYVKGASGYTTAWTNRATQTYDYFYNIF